MAKVKKKKFQRKVHGRQELPFKSVNYWLFAAAIVIILLGYVALARGPADSFWSLTLAPILLVVAYCVIIPLAIIYSGRWRNEGETH